MKAHPLAMLLPALDDEALRELVADIKEYGQREAIVTLDGMILDGRNRYRACELAGVVPNCVVFGGGDPVAFVASKNLYRRHLNESQRAMVAAKIVEIFERSSTGDSAEDRAAIAASVVLPPIGGRSGGAARAAAAVNVGTRSVERAQHVRKNAVPEVVAAVEGGTLAVSVAANLARRSPEEQRRALVEPPRSNRRPLPAFKPQPFTPPAEDPALLAVARYEDRLAKLLADLRSESPRVRGLLVHTAKNFADQLLRLTRGAA